MVRRTLVSRLLPDVHRLAPELNSGFVHRTVRRAVQGVGPLPPAAMAAEKQLDEQEGDVDRAIHELVENHVGLAAAEGFVTNVGGLVASTVTIPVNIAGLALLQARLVAGIAHLRGYDLQDGRVRNAILLCILGEDTVKKLVTSKKVPGTPMLIATAPAYDPSIDSVVAAEVTSALVGRVVGKRAAGTVIRKLPIAGGVWGGSVDGYSTWQVGRYAARELLPRPPAHALGARRPSRAARRG